MSDLVARLHAEADDWYPDEPVISILREAADALTAATALAERHAEIASDLSFENSELRSSEERHARRVGELLEQIDDRPDGAIINGRQVLKQIGFYAESEVGAVRLQQMVDCFEALVRHADNTHDAITTYRSGGDNAEG